MANLRSREAHDRQAGLRMLARAYEDACVVFAGAGGDSDDVRRRAAQRAFQAAVSAADGVALVVRALRACQPDHRVVQAHLDAAYLISPLGNGNSAVCGELVSGGCAEPLFVLLASSVVEVQCQASRALYVLATVDAARAIIVAAGGIPALIALLHSPSESPREAACGALRSVRDVRAPPPPREGGGPRKYGSLSAARVREIQAAVALLHGAGAEREAGVHMLAGILEAACAASMRSVGGGGGGGDDAARNAALSGIRDAIAAEGGVPLLVSLLPADAAAATAPDRVHVHVALATVVAMMSSGTAEMRTALGGAIAPLIALLGSTSVDVQGQAAGALCNLSTEGAHRAAIGAAGGIPPLVALSASRFERVREPASRALHNMRAAGVHGSAAGANRTAAAAADVAAVVVTAGGARATARTPASTAETPRPVAVPRAPAAAAAAAAASAGSPAPASASIVTEMATAGAAVASTAVSAAAAAAGDAAAATAGMAAAAAAAGTAASAAQTERVAAAAAVIVADGGRDLVASGGVNIGVGENDREPDARVDTSAAAAAAREDGGAIAVRSGGTGAATVPSGAPTSDPVEAAAAPEGGTCSLIDEHPADAAAAVAVPGGCGGGGVSGGERPSPQDLACDAPGDDASRDAASRFGSAVAVGSQFTGPIASAASARARVPAAAAAAAAAVAPARMPSRIESSEGGFVGRAAERRGVPPDDDAGSSRGDDDDAAGRPHAARSRAQEGSSGGGGGNSSGAGTGGATLRDVPAAVSQLCSRGLEQRDAGLATLLAISDGLIRGATAIGGGGSGDHGAAQRAAVARFREALAAAGGVRPITRLLRASYASPYETACHAAFLVQTLASGAYCGALASAGCIVPLISLLGSPSDRVQAHAAGALNNLSSDGRTRAAILAAGGDELIPRLVALSRSRSEEVRTRAAHVLHNLRLPSAAASWSPHGGGFSGGGGMVAGARARLSSALTALASSNASDRASGVAELDALLSSGGGGGGGDSATEDAMVGAGAIAPLLRVLSLGAPHSDTRVHAVALVRRLCEDSFATRRALVAAPGCVPSLIALLLLRASSAGGPPAQAQEHAALALCSLIDDDDADGAITATVAAAGGLAPLTAQLASRAVAARVAAALRRMSTSDEMPRSPHPAASRCC